MKIGDGAAGDLTSVRPAAAAPPRRPEQVEQHRAAEAKIRRARFFGYHPPTDKEHHPASRKCRREHTPEITSGAYKAAAGERLGIIVSAGNTTAVTFD